MISPSYQRPDFAPKYVRAGSPDACDHVLHPHTVYDHAAAVYRAHLRCRCDARTATSRRAHATHAPAEHYARAWLARRQQRC